MHVARKRETDGVCLATSSDGDGEALGGDTGGGEAGVKTIGGNGEVNGGEHKAQRGICKHFLPRFARETSYDKKCVSQYEAFGGVAN